MKSIITTGIVALLALGANEAEAQQNETWRLTQVNGAALPAVTDTDDDGCREEVTAGTLTLESDGRWTLEVREREVCASNTEEETEKEDGRYSVQADAIAFTDDDGDTEDGYDVDDIAHGARAGSTLTVRTGGGETTLVFQR